MACRAAIVFGMALLGIPALSGCKTWAQAGEHAVTIEAPATVHRGEKFFFTVTVKGSSGNVLPGVAYQWKVDWGGVEGIFHNGKSTVEQRINVKGAPGAAILHIFGYDDQGQVTEVGKREFQVK